MASLEPPPPYENTKESWLRFANCNHSMAERYLQFQVVSFKADIPNFPLFHPKQLLPLQLPAPSPASLSKGQAVANLAALLRPTALARSRPSDALSPPCTPRGNPGPRRRRHRAFAHHVVAETI